jgi:hypothetical protein
MEVMGVPDFLTVTEAARVLRIGRTAAYELAVRYEATGGAEGLPVIRIGRQLRVPTARLEALAGRPLTEPTAQRPRTKHHRSTANQSTLPLD